jgi:two-component system phosphate regulon sensor histidine kinase PhoR
MLVIDALAYQEDSFEDQLTLNQRTYRTRLNTLRLEGHAVIALALQDVTDVVHLKRARREMVANISHELRTPIANIRLIIDGLFHEGEKPKGKASRVALKDIAREIDSLLWLVQELWDLSMIESGDAILRAIEMPLLPIVQEAVERMEDQGSEKDLRLRYDVPAELMVLADRDQIRRVLMNLIQNAIKHSPAGGTIIVSAERKDLDAVISVVDEGAGVPEEHLDRIFERFYQVDPARSRGTGTGTGLGLAICKHIVEAHSGRIWAASNREGSGGRFYFTLPLDEASSV